MTRTVKVKICGIRRREDAWLAVDQGADAIGVLVGQHHPSPDFITAEEASAILRHLPPFVSGVLVSHVESAKELLELIQQVQPAAVQLHSPMSPDHVAAVRRCHPALTLLKVVHANGPDPLTTLRAYSELVNGVVADSCNPSTGQVGGTGVPHDWSVSAELVRHCGLPLILAGGLTPTNVAAAIAQVGPWGVDVNSGVKGDDGFKSARRLKEFIHRAREHHPVTIQSENAQSQ